MNKINLFKKSSVMIKFACYNSTKLMICNPKLCLKIVSIYSD